MEKTDIKGDESGTGQMYLQGIAARAEDQLLTKHLIKSRHIHTEAAVGSVLTCIAITESKNKNKKTPPQTVRVPRHNLIYQIRC